MLTLKLQSACATALTVVQAAVRTTGQASGSSSRHHAVTARTPPPRSDEILVVTGRGTGRISPMADLADESADFSVTVSSIPRKQRRSLSDDVHCAGVESGARESSIDPVVTFITP